MTVRELSQYQYLKREIDRLEREIDRLELRTQPGAQVLTGMPRSPGTSDVVASCAASLADIRDKLAERLARCLAERARLEAYIDGIDESLTRQVFALRFVDGLSWSQVARRVGGGNTWRTVSMICYRYIDRHQN